MNESMNAVSKNSDSLACKRRKLFEKLCECNEHREFEEFEVRSCVGKALQEHPSGLHASQGLFEKLCECNEHREFEEFEVRSIIFVEND